MVNVIEKTKEGIIVRDRNGKLWLTRRQRRRKDSRRRILTNGWSVRHIPIKRIIEKGDWLFTCSMEPQQFSHWDDNEQDGFETLNGSSHSRKHCSLSPISDEYAAFFIKHKLWELFEVNDNDFGKYEAAVKKVCEAYKVKYEGT